MRLFNRYLTVIKAFRKNDYGRGYERGLIQNRYGKMTPEEHEAWMRVGTDRDPQGEDPQRRELGRGYRDGFAGRLPE